VLGGALMLVGIHLGSSLGARIDRRHAEEVLRHQPVGRLHHAVNCLLTGSRAELVTRVCGNDIRAGAAPGQDATCATALLGDWFADWFDGSEKAFVQTALMLSGLRLWQESRHAVPAQPMPPQPVGAKPPAVPAALQLVVRGSKLPGDLTPGPLLQEAAVALLQQATRYRCTDPSDADKLEDALHLGEWLVDRGSEDDVYLRLETLVGRGLLGATSKFGLRTALAEATRVQLTRLRRLESLPSLDVLNRFEIT
jgi:hypothetical protein